MWTRYELISYGFFLTAVTLTGLRLLSTLFFTNVDSQLAASSKPRCAQSRFAMVGPVVAKSATWACATRRVERYPLPLSGPDSKSKLTGCTSL